MRRGVRHGGILNRAAEHHPDALYPPVSELPIVSRRVAAAVLSRAHAEGVATAPPPEDPDTLVASATWKPAYLPVRRSR